MLSMFKEKDGSGGASHWSMTRVVAFISAVTLNGVMFTLARNNHVHDIAWPFCAMYVVSLLAVPLQSLFKMIQMWLDSGPGKKLLANLLNKVETSAASHIKTTTEINPGGASSV